MYFFWGEMFSKGGGAEAGGRARTGRAERRKRIPACAGAGAKKAPPVVRAARKGVRDYFRLAFLAIFLATFLAALTTFLTAFLTTFLAGACLAAGRAATSMTRSMG